MVLEGLKRAERLLGLLRRVGFQRSDGRPLKPEHLDSEFENRQYAAALEGLLEGLQARILTEEEYARLEYLARLGLLDGLLDGVGAGAGCEAAPEEEGSSDGDQDIVRLKAINGQLADLLDALATEELALQAQVESLPTGADPRPPVPAINPLTPAPRLSDTLAMLQGLLSALSQVNSAISTAVHRVQQQIQLPINLPDGVMRFRTVQGGELLLQPWRPPDFALYAQKIQAACQQLASQHGVVLAVERLLNTEQSLDRERQRVHQTILESLVRVESERLALRLVLKGALESFLADLQCLQATLSASLRQLQDLLAPVQQYLDQDPTASPRLPIPHSQHSCTLPGEGLAFLTAQLDKMAVGAASAKQAIQAVMVMAAGGNPEIEPIPEPIRAVEEELRSRSLGLSKQLTEATIQANRLCLLHKSQRLA